MAATVHQQVLKRWNFLSSEEASPFIIAVSCVISALFLLHFAKNDVDSTFSFKVLSSISNTLFFFLHFHCFFPSSPQTFSVFLPFPASFLFLFLWTRIHVVFLHVKLRLSLVPWLQLWSDNSKQEINSRHRRCLPCTHAMEGGGILFRQLLVPLLLALHQTMELNGKKKRLRKGEIFGEAVLVLGMTDKATDGNSLGERLDESNTLTKPQGLVMKPGYQDTVWWSNRHLIYHHSVSPVWFFFHTHLSLWHIKQSFTETPWHNDWLREG